MQREPNIPQDVKETIDNYVTKGWSPGSFVQAVLENDLKGACGSADMFNREALFDIVSYCYNCIPSNVWGSPDKVANHLRAFANPPIKDLVYFQEANGDYLCIDPATENDGEFAGKSAAVQHNPQTVKETKITRDYLIKNCKEVKKGMVPSNWIKMMLSLLFVFSLGITACGSDQGSNPTPDNEETFTCSGDCQQPGLCDYTNTTITIKNLDQAVSVNWIDDIIIYDYDLKTNPTDVLTISDFLINSVYETAKGKRLGNVIFFDLTYDDICRTGHETPTCSDQIPLKQVTCLTSTFTKVTP